MDKCQYDAALITAYLDGELSKEEAARFEAHMQSCPACEETVQWHQFMHDELSSLPEETMPDGLTDRILDRVRRERKPSILRFLPRRIFPTVAAAALLALVIGNLWPAMRPACLNTKDAGSAQRAMAPMAAADAALPQAEADALPESADMQQYADGVMTGQQEDDASLPLTEDKTDGTSGNEKVGLMAIDPAASLYAVPSSIPLPALPYSQMFAFFLVAEGSIGVLPDENYGMYEQHSFESFDVVFLPASELDATLSYFSETGILFTLYEDAAVFPQIDTALDTGLIVLVEKE